MQPCSRLWVLGPQVGLLLVPRYLRKTRNRTSFPTNCASFLTSSQFPLVWWGKIYNSFPEFCHGSEVFMQCCMAGGRHFGLCKTAPKSLLRLSHAVHRAPSGLTFSCRFIAVTLWPRCTSKPFVWAPASLANCSALCHSSSGQGPLLLAQRGSPLPAALAKVPGTLA